MISATAARAFQQRIATSGFTTLERTQMQDVGMTNAEIDTVRARIAARDLTALENGTYRQRLEQPRLETLRARATYDSLATQLDEALSALSGAWTGAPVHALVSRARRRSAARSR